MNKKNKNGRTAVLTKTYKGRMRKFATQKKNRMSDNFCEQNRYKLIKKGRTK